MAVRTTTQFKALYGSSGSLFPDNTTAEISEGDIRAFGEDIADSFSNESDDAYTAPFPQVTASGTDTYTATLSPAITAYVAGQKFQILFTNANTGAATCALNGLAALAITKNGATALAAGDIPAGSIKILAYDGTRLQIVGDGGINREFNRAFSAELLFDKNEIDYAPEEVTTDLNYTLAGSGHLSNQFSTSIQTLIMDGLSSISFTGFNFIYGISSGDVPDAGTYQLFFMYRNGIATAHWAVPSSEEANLTVLSIPGSFAAVENGENQIDLSWTDVSNETNYTIQYSTTGGDGPWLSLTSPAADATIYSHTGLSAGTTYHYRIKAVGDGLTFADSGYSTVAATTQSAGDVTAPVPTFLPANGNVVWPVNKALTITFDEAIQDADGVTQITSANIADYITLKQTDSSGTDILFTAIIDATKMIVTISPTTTYGTNQLVYLAVSGVEDVNGNEMTLQSITFTTTAYTYHNGTSNRLIFGDILDSVFTVADTNFWIERTLNNANLTGTRVIASKLKSAGDGTFNFYYNNKTFVFFYALGSGDVNQRAVVWENTDMDAGENIIVLKYDGSIDTNDGLDRCTLLINGVVQTGGYVSNPIGTLGSTLRDTTSQLALNNNVNAAGTPLVTHWYEGEAKDFIIRSAAGATVELNVAVERLGTDSSGNARNGTWA